MSAVNEETLTSLAQARAPEETVLSLYLDLDPHRFATAVGLEEVLNALVARRVARLLFQAELRSAGVLCPRGDWLGVAGESCPLDGAPLEPRANIVEDAIRWAVSQSAEILPLRDRSELGPFGGIAATLRF